MSFPNSFERVLAHQAAFVVDAQLCPRCNGHVQVKPRFADAVDPQLHEGFRIVGDLRIQGKDFAHGLAGSILLEGDVVDRLPGLNCCCRHILRLSSMFHP